MTCNFCTSSNLEKIYTPINSKINLDIHICCDCGLVQSSYDVSSYEKSNNTLETKFKNLDCDAGYSEIRVGKQQMAHYIFDALKTLNIDFNPKKVLDMKSARGHFALQALEHFNLDSIDCIEEDDYMTKTYKDNPKINIYNKKYHTYLEKDYDLVYSCHTLEHYQNPTKYLKFIRTLLKDDGMFYIDVPNINNIDHQFNIDEFFYDKHLYYYDTQTLLDYIQSLGFTLLNQCSTPQNIGLLFKKSKINTTYPQNNQYNKNKKLISNYKLNISLNRDKLSNLNLVFENKNNLIFGCGRPLDAFIKYSNLNLDNFDFLVDDFLSEITQTLYNKPLYNSSVLDKIQVDNVLLLVKHPSEILLNRFKGNPNIIFLSEVLNG